jgi:hypothetical protein
MNKFLFLLFSVLFLCSCDCYQKANGVVLDNETKQPLEKVAFGKYEKQDTTNSYSSRSFSDDKGQFEYSSTGGSLGSCYFDLYFSKEGYESIKVRFQQISMNDTVYLKRKK